MSKIIVKNNGPLSGEVNISGSKNSALPIIAACVMTEGKNTLFSIPDLSDIQIMLEIISALGGEITKKGNSVTVCCDRINRSTAPYEPVNKIRGSFLLAGALLARFSSAKICMPGGCPIGSRPVDLHLKGFAAMGASVSHEYGYITLSAKKLRGASIYLDFPSVGATENILMAACLAEGDTVIENAAAEPEVADLADFLIKCGAKISGAGSDRIQICGVERLHCASHKIIPDRIEAGTFMTAIALTRGRGKIKNISCEHIQPIYAKLSEMGVELAEEEGGILVDACRQLVSTDIKTMPFPGFPTDMQAQFCGLLSTASGTGIITETVFENRFLHMAELKRMGANIKIEGRTSVIEGVGRLTGTRVSAPDLRGGAALVLTGLAAAGTTEISDAYHIRRGYEHFAEKLRALGADVSEEK